MYASNTCLLTLRTSALASVAVSLIAFSTSLARASFSRSGGLRHWTHARTLSIAIKRRVTDLSRRAPTKYGKSEISWVWSIIVRIVALAREMKTLFGREQRDKRVGIKRGTRGSKDGPSPAARVAIHSTAVAERRERSEAAAEVIERYIERMEEVRVAGKSHAPPFDRAITLRRVLLMVSHVSSVSARESEARARSSSSLNVDSE